MRSDRVSALVWPLATALLCWSTACGQAVLSESASRQDAADATAVLPADAVAIPEPATCPVGHEPPGLAEPPALAQCVSAGPDPLVGTNVMASALPAKLGRLDSATGAFAPYHAGQWAKLQPGLQGAGHVEMRLLMADATAPEGQPLVVEIAREVWFDCATRLAMGPSKQKFTAAPQPGWWLPSSYLATIVPMPPWLGCGRWALFRTFWRVPGQANWQMAQVTVRLYLGDTAEPLPP